VDYKQAINTWLTYRALNFQEEEMNVYLISKMSQIKQPKFVYQADQNGDVVMGVDFNNMVLPRYVPMY
jgi:hypothetical protein